jgi:hypothetical protein
VVCFWPAALFSGPAHFLGITSFSALAADAIHPFGDNIEQWATQAGDMYAAMFGQLPDADGYIKDALLNAAALFG